MNDTLVLAPDLSDPALSPSLALAEDVAATASAIDPALLGISIACLGVASLSALAAAALVIYSPTKLATRLGGNGRAESVVRELEQREGTYHAVASMLALLLLGAATVLAWESTPVATWPRVCVLAAVAGCAVLGCALLPARIAEMRAEAVVLAARRPLAALHWLAWPLRPLRILTRWTLRILRIPETPPTEPEVIRNEILAAVGDSAQEVELDHEERGWLLNIVALRNRRAEEVMTPRTDIVAFDRSMPLRDAIQRATEAGHSRYPVYDGQRDDVVGVFYAKDALALLDGSCDLDTRTVGDSMRKPLFVPETRRIVDLLREFRASKVQMAILLDEYGGITGLVSIEDILEEIVGDINDEYDLDEEAAVTVIEEGRVVEATGRARVDEVNEHLGTPIPEGDDYDTVAGFVFQRLDRIPKPHERLQLDQVEIEILGADERRISRMRLTSLAPATTDGSG